MRQLAAPLGGRGKKFCVKLTRNLKAELPQMERDKLVAEWERLVGNIEVLAQLGPKVHNGRPRGGVREAARQLGLSRQDVERAIKVASISAGLSLIALAAGQVHKALAPENSPQ